MKFKYILLVAMFFCGITEAATFTPAFTVDYNSCGNDHVKSGQIGFTQAAEGVTYPVGGNVSRLDLLGKAVSKTGK